MKNNQERILKIMTAYLDASKYKVYKDSMEYFEEYVLINYQSNSVVDFNIPDDYMIYGIGTVLYRRCDDKIFEIYSPTNKEEQIRKILNER